MLYLEAPVSTKGIDRPAVFLAGGITDCEDWQKTVVEELRKDVQKGTILNPRRAEFPMDDPSAAAQQIMWEQTALWAADVIAIWFAGGSSVQPIVMFEFGCHLGRYCIGGGPKKLLVGIDPKYKRKQDVELQLRAHDSVLNGPWKIIPTTSLDDHILSIKKVLKTL
jgi:hypothetical protein